MAGQDGTDLVPRHARGIVATACVVTAASVALSATSNYLLQPVAEDFGLDSDEATILSLAPTLATILVVFLAGSLGDRLGHRRVITWASVAFLAGCLLTALSAVVPLLVFALCLTAAAATVMTIVAIALLSDSVSGAKARATAFGTLGVVSPAVYLVAPVIAGALVTWMQWRPVVLVWGLLGVVGLVMARRLLPPAPADRAMGELLTPTLGGLVLVLGTQTLTRLGEYGILAPATVVTAVATAVAALILWAVHRRMTAPSLAYEPVRRIRPLLLLIVCALVPLTSMWFTTYLVFQYLFELTPAQISLILIPTQVAGMVGAMTMPRLIMARSLRTAALLGFAALTLSELSFLLAGTESLALLGILMVVYGLVTGALSVAISNAVMNAAPAGEPGAMAAYRSAASRIGGALAPLMITTLVLGTYQASLADRAVEAGLDPREVRETATYIADQLAGTDESVTQIPRPESELEATSALQQEAILDALRAKALAGAAIAVSGGLVLGWAMRSRREDELPGEGGRRPVQLT